MSYFRDHYDQLRWPIDRHNYRGWRTPQRGALHAVAAHFTRRSEPAIVTMPTGSGKTAVLMATAFALCAERVLVLTPGRLVREQIFESFSTLNDLRSLNVLPGNIQAPSVYALQGSVVTDEQWEALRAFDVVVGIPQSISPERDGIPNPPSDLFDLILVDEAHHSPARTWQTLLECFPGAKRVLFTATPFRRDEREIIGNLVYTYELREAYSDGVFGQIDYQAIEPPQGLDPDIAIARAAQETLRADQAAGLQHLLMVRTSTRARAEELVDLYTRETDLRLKLITGKNALRHVRAVLRQLENNDLDGIICVDMFGEGFNFPRMKVAAVHKPYRSLSVTLQFIGRFARTNAPNTGRAKFLALASDMRVERESLYVENAVWHELVPSLSTARIAEEERNRAVLNTFRSVPVLIDNTPNVSLYEIHPYFHVKILQTESEIDIRSTLAFPANFTIVHHEVSEEHNASIYITRQTTGVRWTAIEGFESVLYDLFVVHYHQESRLLFICASRRIDSLYQHLIAQFAQVDGPTPRGLSGRRLNKVLLDCENIRLFNIGMRNSTATKHAESYRTLTGSSVDQAIDPSDARSFRRGHWFGSVTQNGSDATIGLSIASKVWSNTSGQIPQLIDWCNLLAIKLISERFPETMSGLDHLPMGEEALLIPEGIVYTDWNQSAYREPMIVRYFGPNREVLREQLLDLELCLDRSRTNSEQVSVILRGEMLEYCIYFSLNSPRGLLFEPDPDNVTDVVIESNSGQKRLLDYLNERPLIFYTADFLTLEGRTMYLASSDEMVPFEQRRLETPNWVINGVDISHEFGPPTAEGCSIHDFLANDLQKLATQVVFYDHGSGELADYVTIMDEGQDVRVTLYHCKGASGQPGERVDDLYEVCQQAV
ncbi:DEAD/DEAH box helicase, partial [Scytonema tolypothrichoides VB-61278]